MTIGKPIQNPKSVFEIRQAVQELSAESVEHRIGKFKTPAHRLIKQCKKRKFFRENKRFDGAVRERWRVVDEDAHCSAIAQETCFIAR